MFGSIIRDISRRKRLEGEREHARAQAELARERAEAASRAKDRMRMQLDAVLYSSIDAVLVADAKGDIVAWNRAARTMFGWEEYEALGAPITIVIPPPYHAAHHSGFEKVVATGHSNLAGKLLELTARRKDGTQFPIELTLSVWKDGDAAMFGAIMRDISGRKTLEAERARALADAEQAREAAETASRAKSSFLAMMGHELRTPLNAVIGFSEMMANEVLGPIGNQTYREYSQDIVGSGNHLLGVINDVLDYATIDNGAVKLHPEAIAVPELVGEAEQIMSLQAGKRLIAMKVSLAPNLPPFVGDRHKLRQVLLNLLGNAIKFTDPGGSITVTAERRRDGAIAIAVSDTGIGMSPEDAAHALEPFFQADGALSRKYQGVGLGLAIARQLVELHGGVLTLDSQVGKGTTVTFTLPPTTAPARAAHFDI